MYSDFHLHTDFSADSQASPESQIRQAIAAGIPRLCITDHQDFDYPKQYNEDFTFPTNIYFTKLSSLKEEYEKKIQIFTGVELGLRVHLQSFLKEYTESWPFDFVIGSVHLVDGRDPYYPDYFEGRSEEAAYREYFECILENVELHWDTFDSLGHLDYAVRYGPNQNKYYSYEKYRDIIDEILKILVNHGKALECNTSGLSCGLGHTNPHPDIIKRFVQLGGEMITIGSDAHKPANIGFGFHTLKDMLAGCGVSHYTEFHRRKPVFYPL